MEKLNIDHTVIERFLQYVKIDTQSNQNSTTYPSTEKQKDLGNILVEELKSMGIDDAELDEYGYVYATIPSNTEKVVPVVCLCSHMDTSPDVSGKNVNPIVHNNYRGGDIILPKDNSQIIKYDEYEDLQNQVGNDIITTDGTTLLGADDKAGVAEIMDAANYLISHTEIKHGKIRILFTPDEEVGKGVDKVDMEKLSADIGYTVDGSELGTIEDETFSADALTITIHGFNIHPGSAKDKMENAIKIASEILNELPKDKLSPETTEKKEGFVHPVSIFGAVDKVVLKFIIRDFETEGLSEKENFLKEISENVLKKYKRSSFEFDVSESYRNMKFELDKKPEAVEYALEAVKRCNIEPKIDSIRGGTDGSRLSYMGLPCPNIFTGGHAYHSKLEWISVQDMEKAVETLINLCIVWEEKS